MPPPGPDIMTRLKSSTDDLHRMAEGRQLQRRLVKGEVGRALYAAFLGQMYLVHRALEGHVRASLDRHPAFSRVLRDHHWREQQLHDDITFLGEDPDEAAPLPATRRLIEEIRSCAESQPVGLLGMLYVLEGSTNGSKLIAAALRRALRLAGPGVSYLDPHGDRQKERWLDFKRDMNAAGFTEDEADVLVDRARLVFSAVAAISDELLGPRAAAAASSGA